MKKVLCCAAFALAAAFALTPLLSSAALNVPITVKETAGVGAEAFPVLVVVPLPYGQYQNTDALRLFDADGDAVPAQFSVLNRWAFKDNSIRHVTVQFLASVPAFSGSGSGVARYSLRDSGSAPSVSERTTVTDGSGAVTITTGPLKFTVSKNRFTIIDEAWLDEDGDGNFEDNEKIISSDANNGGTFVERLGGVQRDSSRSDVRIEIEERGPIRTVIRAEALTKYNGVTDHTHGYAVRIYAYAGKPYVKIDYQLQNSAKNRTLSSPLYFDGLSLDFGLSLSSPSVRVGLGNGTVKRYSSAPISLAQTSHDAFSVRAGSRALDSGTTPDGFIDVSDSRHGVMAFSRNFWQMWPNGLSVQDGGRLSIELFPRWGSQWFNRAETTLGFYWLDDMRHVYKESFLHFHKGNTSDQELVKLAKTFQYHPVPSVPLDWYRETGVTLDLDGIIPSSVPAPSGDDRTPRYASNAFRKGANSYLFNWDNFGEGDTTRKIRPCEVGSWPASSEHFIATGNPADYFNAERLAIGELNVRPQWIAGYTHTGDYELLKPNASPYCGLNWRKFVNNSTPKIDTPYLPGTGSTAKARDDEHGWFYHLEESYYYTANPWVRDWYEFAGEFRKAQLKLLPVFPDNANRAIAHRIENALQAYRITGDEALLADIRNYVSGFVKSLQTPYGFTGSTHGFQSGFLARSIINLMREIEGEDLQTHANAFNILAGYADFNLRYAHFPYFWPEKGAAFNPTILNHPSSGTGLTMVDPQAWFYWHTGLKKYWDHAMTYVTTGLNGGQRAYGDFSPWKGQYESRYYTYVRNQSRADTAPPAAITDLSATANGSSAVLSWTAPAQAQRYHIVWADKPLSATYTVDTSRRNWWAGNAVGTDLKPVAGTRQSVTVPNVPATFNAAVFTFDNASNMSSMSNVATLNGTPQPPATSTLAISGITATGDFTQTNTCTAPLAIGGSCVVRVAFTPTAAGTRAGSITVTHDKAGSPITIPLSGEGAAAPSASTTLSFTADSMSIASGQSTTLRWTSGNAALCTASGAWSGSKTLSGTFSTGALSQSSTYALSCTGTGGTVAKSVTVTVTQTPPPPPPPATTTMAVTSFTLVNATTDRDIGPLTNGMTIDLGATPKVTIRANTIGTIGSVSFDLNNKRVLVERSAPYSMAGDDSGNYKPWNAEAGSYSLTATPWSKTRARGTAGTPLTMQFVVVKDNGDDDSDDPTPAVPQPIASWGSMAFDGRTTVEIPAAAAHNLPNDGGAVSAWFKMDSAALGQNRTFPIIWKRAHSNIAVPAGYALFAHQSGPTALPYIRGRLGNSNGTGYDDLKSSKTALRSDTWYHAVLTWDENKMYLYLNGNLEASVSRSKTLNITTSQPLLFGFMHNNLVASKDYAEGSIDNAGIFDETLSASEVKALYNADSQGKVQGWSVTGWLDTVRDVIARNISSANTTVQSLVRQLAAALTALQSSTSTNIPVTVTPASLTFPAQTVGTQSIVKEIRIGYGVVAGASARIVPPASPNVIFNRDLKFGAQGEDVRLLQRILNADGITVASFGEGSVGAEGTTFGAQTEAAVKRFQEKYAEDILVPAGLTESNGRVGSATRAKLEELLQKYGIQ